MGNSPEKSKDYGPDRPCVAVILTGGTIQSQGKDRLDLNAYMENRRRLAADELLGRVPELNDFARLDAHQVFLGPSPALGEAEWLGLLRLVHELAEGGRTDGIVITHGTNTLEETAYFLHLTLKTAMPVVLTGAMRPASAMSGDGDLNLVNAVRTAVDPAAAGMGVLAVMNDAIYSARDVTKGATYRVDAFRGGGLGPLGFADSDRRVVFYHRPARAHTLATEFDLQGLSSLPRVPVLLSYTGADGALIDAALAAGAQGIVLAGSGAGSLTPDQNEALDHAGARGVLVCLSSRVGSGRVVQRPELARRGLVMADNLVPWKARILLSLALTVSREPAAVQEMFDRY